MESRAVTTASNKSKEAIAFVDKAENALQDIDAIELYRNAILLDDASIEQNSFDDKAQKALHLCLSKLSFTDDNEKFLDAWKRYIRLLLKYKQWLSARNFLRLYEALNTDSNLPAWHLNASAKLQYEIEPINSVVNPNEVLGFLSESIKSPDGVAQAKSILGEYIEQAKHLHQNNDIDAGQIQFFDGNIKRFVESLSDELHHHWPDVTKGVISPRDLDVTKQAAISEGDAEKTHLYIAELEQQVADYQEEISDLENEVLRLHIELDGIKERVAEEPDTQLPTQGRQQNLRILVLGASHMKQKDIFGIAKKFGLTKDNLELRLDYKKNKRFDLEAIRWISPYSAILIGPIAHKVVGLGANTSVLELLEEEGFPPTLAIRTSSGGLKITKSALTNAFKNVLNKVGAYDPDLLPQAIVIGSDS